MNVREKIYCIEYVVSYIISLAIIYVLNYVIILDTMKHTNLSIFILALLILECIQALIMYSISEKSKHAINKANKPFIKLSKALYSKISEKFIFGMVIVAVITLFVTALNIEQTYITIAFEAILTTSVLYIITFYYMGGTKR
jgi:hypothetical protein